DVLESYSIAAAATGLDGEVKFWSNAAARLWGRPARDIVGKKLSTLGLPGMSGDLLIEKTSAVREARKEREATDGEISVPGRAEQVIVNIEVSPLRNASRHIVGLLYLVTDVTALRHMERDMRRINEEVKASNDKLQATNEELQATNEELETTNEEL